MNKSENFSRRSFLGTAATAAAALAVGPAASSVLAAPSASSAAASTRSAGGFPDDFLWGVASAAYQIEGAAAEDGRRPSIWDTFSKQPGKTVNGDTGDVACDHYHRYEADVKLMAELGVKHYRFSVAWPRIIPDGRGAVNQKGLDFYRRLLDTLQKHGITPHVTLYHWDLPQALQDRYAGWQSREIVNDFGDYATAVVKGLGDRVSRWITLNEIGTFVHWGGYGFGYAGNHAPGLQLKTKQEQWQITHHALLAHGTACQAIRAAAPGKCSVGVAENYVSFVPIIETPAHIAAAKKAFVNDEINGGIIMPLLTGRYGEAWLTARKEAAPKFTDADLKLIDQPLDVLGYNCYTGAYVRAADNDTGYQVVPNFDAYPKMNMPWLNLVPESIYWGVRLVSEAAHRPRLPIHITENGCADGAKPDADGLVQDTDRIMYLRAYLSNVRRAQAEHYPLTGYFPWTLLDNFEWAEGYGKRFGMTYTDFATQRRVPKLSYRWYQEVIRQRQVV